MTKVLAVDFGLKRTGLAISDEMKMFAIGLETVASENLMARIGDLIITENVSTVVLGYPKRLNNEDSHITKNVELLAEAIQKNYPQLEVELLDERFTSKMASDTLHMAGASKKQKKQKELVDMVSATIILQSYLQKN